MKPFSLFSGWRAAVVLTVLEMLVPCMRGAVTEAWVNRRADSIGNAMDEAHVIARDAQGNVIVAGYTDGKRTGRDMLTVKYSGVDGSVLWQKRYNGPGNKEDYATGVAVDGNGNVIVTGYSHGGFSAYDFYTAKYASADGALLWERRYSSGLGAMIDDFANAVALDASGNVIVTGSSGTGTSADFYTAKYSAVDGALLWERRYNSPTNGPDYGRFVVVDANGDVVVTGESAHGLAGYDAYTAKYSGANGAVIWEKRYPGGGKALALDGSGNVVIAGTSSGVNSLDYYTAKYAAVDGAVLWEKSYNGPANDHDYARAVAVDGNGNVVVTGYSPAFGAGNDYYTAVYAATNGALIWEKRYNGAFGDDYALAAAVDTSGNVIVTGYSRGTNSDNYYTAKYAAADGTLFWEKRYNGPANKDDRAQAVTLDGSGNVIVTGHSSNGSDTDFYTAKYAAADGALVWEKRSRGLANNDDVAEAVAVDGNGNVIVTGFFWNGTNYDFGTTKHARLNGAVLWEKFYNGPMNGQDYGRAVALDSSGNVIVAGESWNGTNYDFYAAKYAAADGTLRWEKRYNGPANQDDFPHALAVDPTGNVVVTGRSSNGTNDDYYTAKYAVADGTLLWERRYNGTGNSNDVASAVAVDGNGNVIVTGQSWNTNNPDYYTVKYANEDGAVLWERRYNGLDNSDDVATAVAVDTSGNVAVIGRSANAHSFDFYTAKYAAADGALLWERRYDGPGQNTDYGQAVAADSEGNVFVTGAAYNGAPYYNFTYYTAKYAATNGAILWEQHTSAQVNQNEEARAIAVDSHDNVIVAGSSHHGFPDSLDYYTLKYSGVDGALVWEARYSGPGDSDDEVRGLQSLAVGPEGTVAVTGGSDGDFSPNINGGKINDYLTIVYREPPTINCPAIVLTNATTIDGVIVEFTVTATDDSGIPPTVLCVPPSGSQFPVGQTLVTCAAIDGDMLTNTCSFVVQVLVARSAKEKILAELINLRATTENSYDRKQLDKAVGYLDKSLAVGFWADETHLKSTYGRRVFHWEGLTVAKLCNLIKKTKGGIPEATLQDFINRIFAADRLLASVNIQDAIAEGAPEKRIEQAQKNLAKGDAAVADNKCSNGIDHYRDAWKKVR